MGNLMNAATAALYRPVPTVDLLRHMELHYSDRHVNDLDALTAVLDCCEDEDAKERVRGYCRRRRAAPKFSPGSAHSNNHVYIIFGDPGTSGTVCENPGCGREFTAKRSSARFCQTKCRVAAKRATDVTLTRASVA